MSEEQQPRKPEEWRENKPRSLWIHFTNICDKGKFKVQSDVDGVSHTIFEKYVNQEDGIVCETHNFSSWFK